VGLDDRNDSAGVPGECPGHEWKASVIHLRASGASMEVKCRWCGAVQFEPGLSD